MMSDSESGSARILTPGDSTVVSKDSLERVDADELIASNIDFADDLFDEYLEKLILLLCENIGQSLECVACGDPAYEHEGVKALAWSFITDKGSHVRATGRKAMMRERTSREEVMEVEVPQ